MRLLAAILLALCLPTGAAATAQSLSDDTAAWLSDTLHAEVPAPRVEASADLPWPAWAERPGVDLMRVMPQIVRAWEATPAMGKGFPAEDQGHVLLHELLHLSRATVLEEGVVDAVALDLVPAWAWHFGIPTIWTQGYGFIEDAAYPDEVRLVRALSAAATGKRWRSRPARLWRRALLLGDDATRQAMVETANGRAHRS